jgi:hypothetical protein
MNKVNYDIGTVDSNQEKPNEVFLKVRIALSNTDMLYTLKRASEHARPWHSYTATTDMRDWIGNITKIFDVNGVPFCSVKGYYRNRKSEFTNIRIVDGAIKKIGERVMVTEHLSVDGKLELIASKRRLLSVKDSNLNFINIGWIENSCFRHLRVDPYTGDSKEFSIKV